MTFRNVQAAVLFSLLAAAPALAQGADRGFVRGLGGVSFAGDASPIYGGGVGFRIARNLALTAEVGRVQNIMPGEVQDLLDVAEQEVELELGVPITLDANIPVFFFLGGVRADVPTSGRLKPFIEASAGVGHLSANVHAEVFGVDVSDEANDLLEDESASQFMLAIGGGVSFQMSRACWLDAGYRYHRIATEDPASNTSVLYAALRFAFK
jgi:hypothetical protein